MKEKNLLLIPITILAISQLLFSCRKNGDKENKANNKEQKIEEKKIEEPKKVDEEAPIESLEEAIPKDNSEFIMHNTDIKPFLNEDLIQPSCLKSQNKYYNCDFSNYTNKALTKTKVFTLPMEFRVSYSRSTCGSRFENGEFKEGNFKLKLKTPHDTRSIFPGNFRTKLTGTSLILKDENPWLTNNVGFFDPCFFMIRKIEINFSDSAKEKIKSSLEKNEDGLNFKSILQEIENEPHFDKTSLENFKIQIKDKLKKQTEQAI
ncbi:hypothetical protein [Silvanigrella aquatica]|uniref:Lipoprotein n=1 Tax=Silvanigrella aquatica TaxID=1915309 RepID=A0A1L4CX61_9BACT|nr:hypothetical protein [Silvanigrella aquatica]APJ02540.1 hypothetical protein AXG55_00755 [Silvanigrella aquatica]